MVKGKRDVREQLIITATELTGRPTLQEVLHCLEQHGCVIERRRPPVRIRFPAGTRRRFHIRITRTDHYRIRLPDGWLVTDLVTYDEQQKQHRHLLIVSAESSSALPAGKPSFRDLCDRYDGNLAALAHDAGVSLRSVYFMREGYPVAQQEACRVLEALSRDARQEYTLETVEIDVFSEASEPEHDPS
jgi:hypothetical protein